VRYDFWSTLGRIVSLRSPPLAACQTARDSVVVLGSLSLRPRRCDCVVLDDIILSHIGRKRVGARNARGTSRAPTAIAG